jgi:ATP-dependent RNA helicase RhlB
MTDNDNSTTGIDLKNAPPSPPNPDLEEAQAVDDIDLSEIPEVDAEEDEEKLAAASAQRRRDDDLFRLLAKTCQTFSDLPLHPKVQDALTQMGWASPTPVQKLCLPWTLGGRDVAGFAQTGTGKTGVFLMTIANKLLLAREANEKHTNNPRAVILCPTRELAMQIEGDAEVIFKHTGITSLAVFGGIDYDKQASRIRDGVDVIMATPGRLKDYCKKNIVSLKDISVFVCDEADRMFDMGFIEDVEFFLKRIPESSQRLLFSATTNEEVKELAFEYLESPEYISVTPETLTPEKIEQTAIHCHATQKLRVIMGLLRDHAPECSLIFTNTKLTAEWLHFKLQNNGIDVDLITGDLPQKKRTKLIETIKEGKLKALIATDVASRGLHISRVTHVYNFDLPEEPANYIHRIGRTARAGARGVAVSLVCDDYGQNLAGINAMLGPALALKSEWSDESYLKIEDKAGDPFKDRQKNAMAAREQEQRERGGDRGRLGASGRGPRHDGDRSRGRHERGRHERGRQERGRQEHDDRKDQKNGQRSQQGRGTGQNPRGQEGAPRAQQNQSQGQGGGRGRNRGRGQQDHGRSDSRHSQQSVSFQNNSKSQTQQNEAAPKSLGGMVKKLVKLLFGKS